MTEEEKRCENCIHNEEHLKAIQEGKQGSAICMLECNPNHICFIPKRKGNVKDEEMAEEYANKHTHYEVGKREDGTSYAKQVSNVTIQQAFLAGLKAGRPQWHDLRENPNDLPEDTYDVLDQAGYKVHYNFFQNVWVNEKDEIDEHVIAWCEIPTFDKEQIMFEKEAEESFMCKKVLYKWETDKRSYIDGFSDGAEFGYNKANEWHDINITEPSKEQLGKQLLIRMKSVIGDTDYDYLVYKYSGESITDVPDVIAWCEIPTFDKE